MIYCKLTTRQKPRQGLFAEEVNESPLSIGFSKYNISKK